MNIQEYKKLIDEEIGKLMLASEPSGWKFLYYASQYPGIMFVSLLSKAFCYGSKN